MKMNETNRPSKLKSALYVLPCSIIFFISRTLSAFLLALVCVVLSKIPIINLLLELLIKLRGESLTMTITVISVLCAYSLTTLVQNKIIKNEENKKLSRKILGILIAIVHIFSFVVNFTSDGNLFANIVCIVAALVFIFSDRE